MYIYTAVQKFGASYFFMLSFIPQMIEIESDNNSKDFYNVTKVLLICLFFKESWKKVS